jgi:hypothetical protein
MVRKNEDMKADTVFTAISSHAISESMTADVQSVLDALIACGVDNVALFIKEKLKSTALLTTFLTTCS